MSRGIVCRVPGCGHVNEPGAPVCTECMGWLYNPYGPGPEDVGDSQEAYHFYGIPRSQTEAILMTPDRRTA